MNIKTPPHIFVELQRYKETINTFGIEKLVDKVELVKLPEPTYNPSEEEKSRIEKLKNGIWDDVRKIV